MQVIVVYSPPVQIEVHLAGSPRFIQAWHAVILLWRSCRLANIRLP